MINELPIDALIPRISDYRIGIELLYNSIVRFIIIAHRKEIYKIFP
jgi:mRNA-degrading endonuclease RelE of RelBE toxin-antitoxin system